jgi:hypothetical protein
VCVAIEDIYPMALSFQHGCEEGEAEGGHACLDVFPHVVRLLIPGRIEEEDIHAFGLW